MFELEAHTAGWAAVLTAVFMSLAVGPATTASVALVLLVVCVLTAVAAMLIGCGQFLLEKIWPSQKFRQPGYGLGLWLAATRLGTVEMVVSKSPTVARLRRNLWLCGSLSLVAGFAAACTFISVEYVVLALVMLVAELLFCTITFFPGMLTAFLVDAVLYKLGLRQFEGSVLDRT